MPCHVPVYPVLTLENFPPSVVPVLLGMAQPPAEPTRCVWVDLRALNWFVALSKLSPSRSLQNNLLELSLHLHPSFLPAGRCCVQHLLWQSHLSFTVIVLIRCFYKITAWESPQDKHSVSNYPKKLLINVEQLQLLKMYCLYRYHKSTFLPTCSWSPLYSGFSDNKGTDVLLWSVLVLLAVVARRACMMETAPKTLLTKQVRYFTVFIYLFIFNSDY